MAGAAPQAVADAVVQWELDARLGITDDAERGSLVLWEHSARLRTHHEHETYLRRLISWSAGWVRKLRTQIDAIVNDEGSARSQHFAVEIRARQIIVKRYNDDAVARACVENDESTIRKAVEQSAAGTMRALKGWYLRLMARRSALETEEEAPARAGIVAAEAAAWQQDILDRRYRAWTAEARRQRVARETAWRARATPERCARCARGMGIFKRRCKCCGDVFCDGCAQHKAALPLLGYPGKEVVCNECFDTRLGVCWRRDSDVTACEDCAVSFSLLTRRHHCRRCGGVFCSACTPNRQPLVFLGFIDPQIVCNACALRQHAPSPLRTRLSVAQLPAVAPPAKQPPVVEGMHKAANGDVCTTAVRVPMRKEAVVPHGKGHPSLPDRDSGSNKCDTDSEDPLEGLNYSFSYASPDEVERQERAQRFRACMECTTGVRLSVPSQGGEQRKRVGPAACMAAPQLDTLVQKFMSNAVDEGEGAVARRQ